MKQGCRSWNPVSYTHLDVYKRQVVGNFTKEIQEEVGFDCTVVLPATHDTGSAVLAVPTNDDNAIYISSGTWSLMGIERKDADCSMESMRANFTNEGGYDYRFRFLKNIMGLWMIPVSYTHLDVYKRQT